MCVQALYRLRTDSAQSLQQFATDMAEQVAERKGWTFDGLRWRSTPDAGLDQAEILPLDFGDQEFVGYRPTTSRSSCTALTARISDDGDMTSEAKKSSTRPRRQRAH